MIREHQTNAEGSLADEIRPLVERLFKDLERLSYYKILGVGQGASPSAIQQAFYRRAVQLHPDRHHGLEDEVLKSKISKIYKRISEGYRVLSSTRTRRLYDRGLRRGELRLGQHAPSDQAEAPTPRSSSDTPNQEVQAVITQTTAYLKERSFDQAIQLLENALSSFPDSPRLQSKIKDARRLKRLWEGEPHS